MSARRFVPTMEVIPMITVFRSALVCSVLVFGAAMVGCSAKSSEPVDSTDQDLATAGSESEAAAEQSTSLGNLVFFSVASQDPTVAAVSIAADTKLWPTGCATREKDPTNPLVVHITLNNCTGPRGLVHLNGQETVVLSKSAGGALHAELSSQNLTANGKPITHTASADITVMGNLRDVAWKGAWTRTNDKGTTISHTSDLAIVVDTSAQCRTTNGSAVTMVGTREIDTTVADYKICKGPNGADECPSGKVTHTAKATGREISVEFDGSNEATVTGPKGGTFDVALVCGS
jgi:hypothetical protein